MTKFFDFSKELPLGGFMLLIHKFTYYEMNKVNNLTSYSKKLEKGQNKDQTRKKEETTTMN